MCSYNKVNGTYACENDYLLNRVLKGDIGFKGQVQSDWGATHSTVPAALAGLDEEEFLSRFFSQPLKDAVLAGEVPMSRLDDMVARKLRGLIAVGVYDDPPDGPGSIDVAAGARVAERLARRSMVLLKNRRRTLPLKRSLDSIAVIGEHADVGALSGGGSSQVTPPGGPAVPPDCEPEPARRRRPTRSPTTSACSSATAGTTRRASSRSSSFGHGLSYTHYRYSRLRLSGHRHRVRVSFEVKNTGRRAGAEVAQVSLGLPEHASEPPKRLARWTRVRLRPGQRRRVSVRIDPERLAIWDADRDR